MANRSVLETEPGVCYICGRWCQTHKHHLFGGPNRKHSEREGLYVYLCPEHHNMSNHSVHMDVKMNRWLQQEGQEAYENIYSHEQFMRIFGRNYKEGNE